MGRCVDNDVASPVAQRSLFAIAWWRSGLASRTVGGKGAVLHFDNSGHSPVAQLVERLTVNDAASYGVVSEVEPRRNSLAELIPSEPSVSEASRGIGSWQLPRETVVDTAGELREACPTVYAVAW